MDFYGEFFGISMVNFGTIFDLDRDIAAVRNVFFGENPSEKPRLFIIENSRKESHGWPSYLRYTKNWQFIVGESALVTILKLQSQRTRTTIAS